MSAFSAYLQDLWRGRASTLAGRLLVILLYLPSVLYGCVVRVRAWCYDHGIFRVHHLPRPVISVGNLTVGGTGKTPVTAWIARHLLEQGLRVVVLSRGYGGSLEGRRAIVSDSKEILLGPDQCGDEPYLLASTVPGLMVVVGSDRHQAGLLAMEQLKPDVFLLDDGYQHLRLHRDLNLLLMDCGHPFGNGRVLPAGPLREPARASCRANLCIFTRCSGRQQPVAAVPACRTHHRLGEFRSLTDRTALHRETLRTGRVLAFAGIADPSAFFDNLGQCEIHPMVTLGLPDHEPYGADTLKQLEQLVDREQIDWLVTTEKDGVKLQTLARAWQSKIVTAQLELVFEDDTLLSQAIAHCFQTAHQHAIV